VLAYLTKDVLHDELLKAIRASMRAHLLTGRVAAALAAQLPSPISAPASPGIGADRASLPNKQIAYTLNIAEHTVKTT